MAENFDLIFGSSASQSYSWNDSDYQNGWQTVGDTPPTREQFDALQRRADLKTQELNNRLAPIEENDTHDYRQPSTAYTAGQIKYHATLPTGWYLECTTAGDTDAGALAITSPSVGDTVTDGTVVWKVGKSLSANGGILFDTTIGRSVTNSLIRIVSGPTSGSGASLILVGKDNTSLGDTKGAFSLVATTDSDTICTLTGYASGKLLWNHNDLAGSAIVAKSLGTNGYVKYASGLIIQWGAIALAENAITGKVTFPISFTGQYTYSLAPASLTSNNTRPVTWVRSSTGNLANLYTTAVSSSATTLTWIAIGY